MAVENLPHDLQALLITPQFAEQGREVQLDVRTLGREPQHLLVARLSGLKLTQAIERHRQIVESLKERGIDLNSLFVARAAFCEGAALNQNRAQRLPRAGAIRFTPQRQPSRRLSCFRVSGSIEDFGMIAMPQ